MTGDGRGGRNQEVALGAASVLDGMPGVLLASVGTDGVDGPTDSAGAVVSGSTLERAGRAGLDAFDALERNDADSFFEGLGDRIVTGPTGTNVMDVQVILLEGRRHRDRHCTGSAPVPRRRGRDGARASESSPP